MQRAIQTLSILSLLALGSCLCAPRGHGEGGKCPYLAQQKQQQKCSQQPCGQQNGGPAGCEPMAMELVGRMDRLERRVNELMRRFDEHQGAMNNRNDPRMQPQQPGPQRQQGPQGAQEPQGPQRRMRATRDAAPQREAQMQGMPKGLQQNIERRVIEVRSMDDEGDPRAMLEELREQLQQMKMQMMKMRKEQSGAKPENG